MFWKSRSKNEEAEMMKRNYENCKEPKDPPTVVFDIKKAIESGMSVSDITDNIKMAMGIQDIEQNPGDINRISLKEPSLQKLLLKGRISQEEYNALCTGNRSDILYAFKLNENYIRESLVREAIEEGE